MAQGGECRWAPPIMGPARCYTVEKAWSQNSKGTEGGERRSRYKSGLMQDHGTMPWPGSRDEDMGVESFGTGCVCEIWLVCEAECCPFISPASPRSNLLAGANQSMAGPARQHPDGEDEGRAKQPGRRRGRVGSHVGRDTPGSLTRACSPARRSMNTAGLPVRCSAVR